MVDLPRGTVTFLLTDIESSTALWEQDAQAMQIALARHDALFDETIRAHNGVHIRPRGEGDSRFAVFASAPDAVAAAVVIQRAFTAEAWPTPLPIKIRIGIHTGEAQPRDSDYYGSTVNRCARLRGIGHGGQILLTEATTVLVQDRLPSGATLVSLGEHRLRGLTRPERVFQVLHPDLPEVRTPPGVSDRRPNNLPVSLTSFIGRQREREELRTLLASERLVTLVGAGGCGKTRLALEVAADRLNDYPDGVWYVELAALSDPARLVQTVNHTLGIREEPDQSALMTLLAALHAKRLLLVLDNCEHLVAACAEMVDAVLRACADVQILATSREALGIVGEIAWRVPSLGLPDVDSGPSFDPTTQTEAVTLFVERAVAARPGFTLTDDTTPAVAQICRQLDGIPLAIELAAARVRVLTPEQIAARLDDRFRLLTSGNRAAVARHQTLQALIEWGYLLLSEREQTVFRRLAAFAGGWTLEAAEAVGAGDTIATDEILDLLARLVDKSLVVADVGTGGSARYRLLETLRQYAQARLAECGDESVRDCHALYFLSLAEQIEPWLEGDDLAVWLDQLEQEHDNLRAALLWLRQRGDLDRGLRLVASLRLFWHLRGHRTEGREWLGSLLALDSDVSRELRARALDAMGFLARFQGSYEVALPLIRESLALRRQIGDGQAIADALNNLGSILLAQGHFPEARALYDEGLATYQAAGNRQGIADSLSHLGLIAFYERRLAAARAAHAESLALWQSLGDHQGVGWALYRLGDVCLAEGDLVEARRYYVESLETRRGLGDQWGIAESLDGLAMLAAARQQTERALRLAGAAAALCAATGLVVAPVRRAQVDRWLDAARTALGTAAVTAWESGRAMSPGDAIADALANQTPSPAASAANTSGSGPHPARLTRREREVADCLARGLSNRSIANALCISERTVERHVENLLAKLDLHSRTQVAVWVASRGPKASRPE